MKKVLPRLRLVQQDNDSLQEKSGSYDDSFTTQYSTGLINLPTTLRVGSKALTADLTSSISFSGVTRKTPTEQWISFPTSSNFIGFFEAGLQEQDIKSTQFYLTGTAAADVGFGFEGNLGQKTILRYDLPVTSKYQFRSTSASLSYYDTATQSVLEANNAGVQDPSTNFAVMGDARLYCAFGTPIASGALYGNPASPSYYQKTSNSHSSFNNTSPFHLPHPWVQADITKKTISDAYQHVMVENVNLNKAYSFNENGVEPLVFQNDNDSPFLLEKVIMELPFEAGSGWFNDTTKSLKINHESTGTEILNNTDAGGPCVTVGLIREFRNVTLENFGFDVPDLGDFINFSSREVIVSGTIIPSGDNQTGYTSIDYTAEGSTSSSYYLTGYNNFSGTPSCVVEPNGSTYTGSIRLEMVPASTNVLYYSYGSGKYSNSIGVQNPTASYGYGQEYLDLFADSRVCSFENLKPYDRSSLNISSGRSIFGGGKLTKGTSVIDGKSSLFVKNPWNSFPSVSGSIDTSVLAGKSVCVEFVGMVKEDVVSPYLLLPGDKLTFFASKYRAAKEFFTGSSYADLYGGGPNYVDAITPHDVKISTGSIKISLYGSYVSVGKEKHTSFAKSKTDPVADVIGDEPVVDQYDVSSPEENIGTYYDEHVVGTFPNRTRHASDSYGTNYTNTLTVNQSNTNAYRTGNASNFYYGREKNFQEATRLSEARPVKETLGSTRVSPKQKHSCSEERIYDSIPLKIDEALAAEGTTGYRSGLSTWYQLSEGTNTSLPGPYTYFRWLRAFPFEPFYSNVGRQVTPSQGYRNISGSVPGSSNFVLFTITKRYTTSADPDVRQASSFFVVDYDQDDVVMNSSDEDNQRYFFGFGDHMSSSLGDLGYESHVGLPTFRTTGSTSDFLVAPIIRGWKYGLASGLPSYSSCVFGKKRYGQFRDMLEQRQFAVFHDSERGKPLDGPVYIKFVRKNADGTYQIVSPEQTTSVNLSPFATSSMPYFDGLSMDRSEEDVAAAEETLEFILPT